MLKTCSVFDALPMVPPPTTRMHSWSLSGLLFSVQPASVSSTVMSLASLPMASSLGEKSPAPPSAQPLLRYPVLLAEPAERG